MLLKKEKNFRLGVVGKLLIGIIIPLIIIQSSLGVVTTIQVNNTVSHVKSDNIYNQINAAANQVQEYFDKFFVAIEFVKGRSSIRDILTETELSTPDFRFENSENFSVVMDVLRAAHKIVGNNVQGVWVSGVKNSQVIQSDGFNSDSSFNVLEREWYKMLQKSQGKPVLTSAYRDVNTGKMIITVASGYYDVSNKIIGVIGLDFVMDELASYLDTISIGETGYITIYDSAKNIIYHPNSETVMKNFADINYSDNMRNIIQNHIASNVVKYERDGNTYFGTIKYLDDYDWTILGCMPKSEYLKEVSFITITTLMGFVICIIIIILFCIYRAKQIIKPLKSLNEIAQEFVKGNLDFNIKKVSDDEIGDLVDVFNETQSGLKEIISDIGYVLQEISNKNLTVTTSAKYQGDFVQIEVSLKGIIDRMNSVMTVINETANQVESGAEHVSIGAQSLAEGTEEQADAIEKLSYTINEISQQMNQMSKHAQEASNRANDVGSDVQQSSNQMQEMMQAMTRIDNSSNEIQKIIKAIEDIAFQTNILALNAAVEAARAGSAGKGFAVVADEVRNLAGKSAEASKTTATLISNSLTAVKDGMLLAEKATESLIYAVNDVQIVANSINNVSSDLNNYADSMQQLTYGIEQISNVVQNNSGTTEQSAAASEELAAQAVNLKQMMSDFNLKDTDNNI